MNVKELIKELEKIEDKELQVTIWDRGDIRNLVKVDDLTENSYFPRVDLTVGFKVKR